MRICWFFICRNLNSLHQRMLCAKIGWNWLCPYVKEDFLKFRQCIFAISLLSPVGKVWSIIWQKNPLNLPHARMIILSWNWPTGSREEHLIIFKFLQCISANSLLSPIGKGRGPSFEQTWILVTQRLVDIWPVVLEKILKFRQRIFAISILSPFGKRRDPSYEETWILFT